MAKASKSYLQLSQELDEILLWFESDEVDLDQAVAKYQEAMQLIQQMEKYLKTAQNKIRKVSAGEGKL